MAPAWGSLKRVSCPAGHRGMPPDPTRTKTRHPRAWRRILTSSEISGPQVSEAVGLAVVLTAPPWDSLDSRGEVPGQRIPFPEAMQVQPPPSASRNEDVLTGGDAQRAPGGPRQPAPSPHHAHGGHAHAHPQELPTPGPGPGPPGLAAWQQQLCGPPAGRPEVAGKNPSLHRPQGTSLSRVLVASPRTSVGSARSPVTPHTSPSPSAGDSALGFRKRSWEQLLLQEKLK